MEGEHFVIKDKHPSDQLIAKVPMTRNRLFSLRIVVDNTLVAFKVESKEEVVHCDKKENDSADFKVAFQTKVQDES